MNKALIISFSTSKTTAKYEKLLAGIKAYGTWARLDDQTYVIVTNSAAATIRDQLKELINATDRLFIGTINAPAAWSSMPEEVTNWLRNHLK